ncbi:MAG: choice-of-anchor D domain-containing protein, partial [Acidobacteria bacterium]|nr:choice-of-anchor D domain-containing protein [Acidobacteriota bacterium]
QMDVNIAAHTYSVYVTSPGEAQRELAANYAFRSEQASVTSLNYWTTYEDAMTGTGALQVCNFSVAATATTTIAIAPTTASLMVGATQQFTATVTGTSNTAVTWTASGGTVTTGGLYTAPNTAGTYTVTATSVADTTKSGSATVTVTAPPPPISVSIAPTTASLQTGGTQQFTATVTGTSNTAVTWTATGGTVTTGGLYTAPNTNGTYTMTATSVADTTKSASATVNVASFSISGTLGSTASGATIALSGAATANMTADANGNYTFTGLGNGTYTVTPSKTGYVFSPASQSVTISGSNKTGVDFVLAAGRLSITPSSFSFGVVNMGSTSAPQTGTLQATSGDVTISSDTLNGGGFVLSGITFPLTIPSGQSSTFSVAFAPAATGAASGSLSFASNASNTPSPATLSGTGAGLSVSGALSFGSVPDGTTSTPQTGTLTAVGANVTINSANPSGAAFSISGLPALPFTIAAGQSLQYSVTFAPPAGSPGPAGGSIAFTSTANSVTQAFSGTGAPNVLLSWNASPTSGVTYNVYRCTTSASACVQSAPANWGSPVATGITVLSFVDLQVTSGQTYYYVVTAANSSGESTMSNVASAPVP